MKRISPSIFARFYAIMFERCHNRRPQVQRERFRTMAGAGRRPGVICAERLRARLYWGGVAECSWCRAKAGAL